MLKAISIRGKKLGRKVTAIFILKFFLFTLINENVRAMQKSSLQEAIRYKV